MTIKYLVAKLIAKLRIPAIRNSKIAKTAKVCSGSNLVNVEMGKYSYIGNFCTAVNTEIGRFCSIADNCIIGGANHPMTWVSTSPLFFQGRNIMKQNFSEHEFITGKETRIGHDVWIGTSCFIKSGVSIGDGAVIGMGSVVTKDVGTYEIWAGNPAKLIRKRFDEETIEKLRLSQWWNYDDSLLKEKAAQFNNVEKFIQQL